MENKKTLFVTCYYNGLDNTILGGRTGRLWHYFYSLKTIINMGSDVVVYTSETDLESLNQAIEQSKYPDKVKVIVYDLYSHPNHNYFQKAMNGTKTDRCNEIMHSKTTWMENHILDGYDFMYWIDCGLSHGGLFPSRFRENGDFKAYFSCSLFNNNVVNNLNKVEDKLSVCYADQKYHIFESKPSELFLTENQIDENCHIIGGIFGGPIDLVKILCAKYKEVLNEMVEKNCLETEEKLLTILYFRYKNMFNTLKFTTWHHEESDMAIYNSQDDIPFYKIFENLNK
jgi:hypothetical protein